VCDLETSRIGAPYIYDISNLRVNNLLFQEQISCEPTCMDSLWIYDCTGKQSL